MTEQTLSPEAVYEEADGCGLPYPTAERPYFVTEDPLLIKVVDEAACIPSRAHPSDSGLDLTPIAVRKQLRSDTWLLGTGIAVKPPLGYYVDMVGRSSISKTDVFVSNAYGVIDEQYRGELMIAVTVKPGTDLASFDIESLVNGKPLVQMILRPLIVSEVAVVDELDVTERGDGGFGHTDEKRA